MEPLSTMAPPEASPTIGNVRLMAKKYWLRLWSVFLFVFVAAGLAGADERLIIRTLAKDISLTIELADDADERNRGLMYREYLDPAEGMLFDFRRLQPVAMWMKNTLIPLDMVFVDEDGKIVHIHERAVPGDLMTIQSPQPVRAVLEVVGGFVQKHGVQIGDRLVYTLFPDPEN